MDSEASKTKGTHKGVLACRCGHDLGDLAWPLDSTICHRIDRCKWSCCGQPWNAKFCTVEEEEEETKVEPEANEDSPKKDRRVTFADDDTTPNPEDPAFHEEMVSRYQNTSTAEESKPSDYVFSIEDFLPPINFDDISNNYTPTSALKCDYFGILGNIFECNLYSPFFGNSQDEMSDVVDPELVDLMPDILYRAKLHETAKKYLTLYNLQENMEPRIVAWIDEACSAWKNVLGIKVHSTVISSSTQHTLSNDPVVALIRNLTESVKKTKRQSPMTAAEYATKLSLLLYLPASSSSTSEPATETTGTADATSEAANMVTLKYRDFIDWHVHCRVKNIRFEVPDDTGVPILTDAHRSAAATLIRKYPNIYLNLANKLTRFGYSFDEMIQLAVDEPQSLSGCVVGDSNAYEMFQDFLVLVTMQCGVFAVSSSRTEKGSSGHGDNFDLRLENVDSLVNDFDANKLRDVHINGRRNLADSRFPVSCRRSELLRVESELAATFNTMIIRYGGSYSPLTQTLQKDDLDFLDAKNVTVEPPIVVHNWPVGRGVYVNRDTGVIMKVNYEDHIEMEVVSDSIRTAFENYCHSATSIEFYVREQCQKSFSKDAILGYHASDPALCGCALTIRGIVSIRRVLERLPAEDIAKLCHRFGMRSVVRSSTGEGSSLSDRELLLVSKYRIGCSEFEIVKAFADCVRSLLLLEGRLAAKDLVGFQDRLNQYGEVEMFKLPESLVGCSRLLMPQDLFAEEEANIAQGNNNNTSAIESSSNESKDFDVLNSLISLITLSDAKPTKPEQSQEQSEQTQAPVETPRMVSFCFGGSNPDPIVEEDCPVWDASAQCLISQFLDADTFKQIALKSSESSEGVSSSRSSWDLLRAVQHAVDHHDVPIGLVCCGEDSFKEFAPLISRIVKVVHDFQVGTDNHFTDMDVRRVLGFDALDSKIAVGCVVEVSRNITGFPTSPCINRKCRRAVQAVVQNSLKQLPEELQGNYYALSDSNPDTMLDLMKNGIAVSRPSKDSLTTVTGAARDWPDARGVFVSSSSRVVVAVNEDDHIKVTGRFDFNTNNTPDAQGQAADIRTMLREFAGTLAEMENAMAVSGFNYLHDEELGYLSSSLIHLGTAMTFRLFLNLERLDKSPNEITALCDALELHSVRANDRGEHVWEICNQRVLGFSEVQIIQRVLDGALHLIRLEKEAEGSQGNSSATNAENATANMQTQIQSIVTKENEWLKLNNAELKYIKDNAKEDHGIMKCTRSDPLPKGALQKCTAIHGLSSASVFQGEWMKKKIGNNQRAAYQRRFLWVDPLTMTLHWSKTGNKSEVHKCFRLNDTKSIRPTTKAPKKTLMSRLSGSSSSPSTGETAPSSMEAVQFTIELKTGEIIDIEMPEVFENAKKVDWLKILVEFSKQI